MLQIAAITYAIIVLAISVYLAFDTTKPVMKDEKYEFWEDQ